MNVYGNTYAFSRAHVRDEASRIPLGETFWKDFADRYLVIADESRVQLSEEFTQLLKTPPENWSADDTMLVRYFNIQMTGEAHAGLPSFRDFVTFYSRLTHVAEQAFERNIGRRPTREEYEAILSDASFPNMMLQMMTNSRDAILPVMVAFEGHPGDPDPNDTSRSFNPNFFLIKKNEQGTYVLEPKEEILNRFREAVASGFAKMAESGKKRSLVRRCPILYIGKFKEMCDWFKSEIAFQYLDQAYPKSAE